ncbi:putative serine/threonine-protein kinase [Iris pallida]|uniref:Serine/threonine-protein kinase n=1 Tax=Iris pallida TaxID=29817 RepID=A0AAX6FWV0_IRIPA|nr:putative serine/threonine-protein kinase [Iris pallida]
MEEERKSVTILATAADAAAAARKVLSTSSSKERVYRGVRMRKWGKWVVEIREPNKRSRIWLGSYSTQVAAARAYDTVVFLLRGRSARLNFPEDISVQPPDAKCQLMAASTRKKATEVGARIDAMQMGLQLSTSASTQEQQTTVTRRPKNPDLNQCPSPDSSDAED